MGEVLVERPYYGQFAWAYDLLTEPMATAHGRVVCEWLGARHVLPGACVLDAGCGTGAYATVLAQHGYVTTGIDPSPSMVALARQRGFAGLVAPKFEVADVLSWIPEVPCDAIVCRGVLNDLMDPAMRREAFASFAAILRPGGVLVVDVREWTMTARRKREAQVTQKRLQTPRGVLTFTSRTTLHAATHSLLIAETHALESGSGEEVANFSFVMRCWTKEEFADGLARAGFTEVEYFGAYDASVPALSTDRLVALATREN